MENYLSHLEDAIKDIGYWCWWDEAYPEVFQIEFDYVLLWQEPTDPESPPPSKVALRFINPKSVSFITKQGARPELNPNWSDLMHDDAIDSFCVSYEHFGINNPDLVQQILKDASRVDNIFGFNPDSEEFGLLPYRLSFWAEDVGLILGSEDFEVVLVNGRISLDEVPALSHAWWDYWRRYYELKGTPQELPKDWVCEVTIPIHINEKRSLWAKLINMFNRVLTNPCRNDVYVIKRGGQ